jgi:hypothetical protein
MCPLPSAIGILEAEYFSSPIFLVYILLLNNMDFRGQILLLDAQALQYSMRQPSVGLD